MAFFILALTLEVISFCYMSFLILSGSFVTRYVKTRKKLAKLGNSLIGLVFVGFAAPRLPCSPDPHGPVTADRPAVSILPCNKNPSFLLHWCYIYSRLSLSKRKP